MTRAVHFRHGAEQNTLCGLYWLRGQRSDVVLDKGEGLGTCANCRAVASQLRATVGR